MPTRAADAAARQLETIVQVGNGDVPHRRGRIAGGRATLPRPPRPDDAADHATVPERGWTRYETVSALLTDDGTKVITRYGTPTDAAQLLRADIAGGARTALTSYQDPAPPLRGMTKQLLTYKRADGVDAVRDAVPPAGIQGRGPGCP